MPTMPTLPTFELPTLPFTLPTIDLAAVRALPSVTLPTLPGLRSFEQVTDATRDAAYVGIGLAVMVAERAQTAGATLVGRLTTGVEHARSALRN